MKIRITKAQCSRIQTAKDLNDLYAYFERNFFQGERESDEQFLNRLPNYFFDTTDKEQKRIDDLVDEINYVAGDYDIANIKRILGTK